MAYNNRGASLQGLGHYSEALVDYVRSQWLDPTDALVAANRHSLLTAHPRLRILDSILTALLREKRSLMDAFARTKTLLPVNLLLELGEVLIPMKLNEGDQEIPQIRACAALLHVRAPFLLQQQPEIPSLSAETLLQLLRLLYGATELLLHQQLLPLSHFSSFPRLELLAELSYQQRCQLFSRLSPQLQQQLCQNGTIETSNNPVQYAPLSFRFSPPMINRIQQHTFSGFLPCRKL